VYGVQNQLELHHGILRQCLVDSIPMKKKIFYLFCTHAGCTDRLGEAQDRHDRRACAKEDECHKAEQEQFECA
jgi:hypothetical protein